MTKKSDKPSLSNSSQAQLFVYGLDEAGKPKGARFSMAEMETVSPIVTAQKLQFFEGNTEELVNLGGHTDDRDHLFRSIATSVAWVLTAPLDDGGDASLLMAGQAR